MKYYAKSAYLEIMELAERLGVKDIFKLPGCWEYQAGDWWIALNGHRVPTKCSVGIEVPPFDAYIEYNGLPAGIIGLWDGVIAADSAVNEDSFIEAVKKIGAAEAEA